MTAKSKSKAFFALFLALVLAISITAYADTQGDIEQVQAEQSANEAALASAEDRIAALEAQKNNKEAYLSELNAQLAELTENLSVLQAQFEEKQAQISAVKEELDAAYAAMNDQYEDMKLRIRYMYENSSSSSLLDSLFSAESFTEFLNRADAYAELTKYDREMLNLYEESIKTVENKKQQLIDEQEAILELQSQKMEQQSQIEAVYETAYHELMHYQAEIESASAEQQALINEIASQNDRLNMLLAKAYEEELAAQKAAEEAAAAAAAQAAASTASSDDEMAASVTEYSDSSETYDDSSSETTAEVSTSSDTSSMTYLGNFKLTAYCPCAACCGSWAGGATASGAMPTAGVTVAMAGVDFGTQLCINGHIYTVQDRGTAYGHVDIFFNTHSEALAFGLQYADVYLVN